MNPTELHEYKRIQSMTDDELCTRYGKMNKENKIEAFYKVLKQEGRAKKLQTQIASDKGYTTRKKSAYKTTPAYIPTNSKPKEVYALRSRDKHDDAGIWVKVFLVYGGNTVSVIEFENEQHDGLLNFTYEAARHYWDQCIEEGYYRNDSCVEGLDLDS